MGLDDRDDMRERARKRAGKEDTGLGSPWSRNRIWRHNKRDTELPDIGDHLSFEEICDLSAPSPFDQIEMADLLSKILPRLTERQEQVIRLHYGLWDGPSIPLKEIAQMLDLTLSRVSAIHLESLRRLRIWCQKLDRDSLPTTRPNATRSAPETSVSTKSTKKQSTPRRSSSGRFNQQMRRCSPSPFQQFEPYRRSSREFYADVLFYLVGFVLALMEVPLAVLLLHYLL